MKYIKDINNFSLVVESIDVYDFGIQTGDSDVIFQESSKLAQLISDEDFAELQNKLPNYNMSVTSGMYPFVLLNLEADPEHLWMLHYYGDYCYGIFRYIYTNAERSDGEIDLVEFCDDIDPVVERLLSDEINIKG